ALLPVDQRAEREGADLDDVRPADAEVRLAVADRRDLTLRIDRADDLRRALALLDAVGAEARAEARRRDVEALDAIRQRGDLRAVERQDRARRPLDLAGDRADLEGRIDTAVAHRAAVEELVHEARRRRQRALQE